MIRWSGSQLEPTGRRQPFHTALVRFGSAGDLDTTFGNEGTVSVTAVGGCTALAVLSTGEILVVNSKDIAPFTPTGSLEPTVTRGTIVASAAASDGNAQPPARASEDLAAFLDGLATAWQNIDRAPRVRRKAVIKHWRRTRIDPFAHSWPLVENWLRAQPDITAKTLMQRLREQLPDVYPTGAQLRTIQRRVQLWRNEQVRRLIFDATGTQYYGLRNSSREPKCRGNHEHRGGKVLVTVSVEARREAGR